jgi:hypothetical protein
MSNLLFPVVEHTYVSNMERGGGVMLFLFRKTKQKQSKCSHIIYNLLIINLNFGIKLMKN